MQITSESVKVGHPDVVADHIAANIIADEKISTLIETLFDLTPRGMMERFDLLNPDIYRKLPRTLFMDDYPWEKTDVVAQLKTTASA